MTATVVITSPEARNRAVRWCEEAPDGTTVRYYKPGRTLSQNDRMWAMLTDVASQKEHNGQRYSTDQWKQLFMHACGHEVHFMAGLSGEPFPAGFRSSKLSKEQMGELMDFMEAWGAQNGVRWSDLPEDRA